MNDELLIKFLLGETDQKENLLVRQWVDSDPANRKHFSQIETIWNTSKNLGSEASIDEHQAWERFKTKRDVKHPSAKGVNRLLISNLMKVAAVLLIAVGSWSVYSYLKTDYTTLVSTVEVTTGTLPDGSKVTLNKNSNISYAEGFEGNNRTVKLNRGEVFFDVTPDKAKPFVINADDVTVTVVGTTFNVRHNGHETEVIVETGVVQVERANKMVTLHAGEKVIIGPDNRQLIKQEITDRLYNYYRTREFVAENTPLWRVVEVLNEAYGTTIVIKDPELKNLKLTTTFKNESLDSILAVISQTFDITVEKTDDVIILR